MSFCTLKETVKKEARTTVKQNCILSDDEHDFAKGSDGMTNYFLLRNVKERIQDPF